MLNLRATPGFCASLLFIAATTAWATQTENHGIHAVPAPGPVTIDGSLDDWDLSGQTLMTYDIENLRDLYSGQVALMYDAANLYVSVHWKDPHPMINHHEPHYQGGKGWAADCVQLRFKTDRIAHVTAWLYSDRQEPAININYGSEGDPFKGPSIMLYQTQGWHLTNGAEMAFKKDPDGKGYVQEIKLPWKLLTDTRTYLPGGSLNMGVELLWGTTDWPDQRYADNLMPGKSSREFFWQAVNDWGPVTLEPHGHLHLPTPDTITKALHPAAEAQGPITLRYTLPRDSRVSLVIDDSAGSRIRNLVPALPRNKGSNLEHWDGLNDAGKSVPPGDYVYRVLYHDPIHVSYAMSFANPGNPTWQTSDGRGAFYGDHSSPHAVAAAGDYVGLACPIGEAGQPLIGCDLNGQRLWGQANRVFAGAGITSLATDGKTLWVASDGDAATIYRVNIANGLYAPWNQEATDEQGQKYRVLDLTVSAAQKPREQKGAAATTGAGPNLTAIAVRGNILALCLAHENKIKLLDAETGVAKSELAVDNPQSVAIDTDGSILVLSQEKILRLTQDGKSAPFNATVYPDAYGLAIDAHRNVYLSVRGGDQNVKVFRPDGSFLREIGKRGGRPSSGPYDANGMLNPAQIAIDSRGRLWVTEENDNPKRTSVWDAQTGRLVKDLAGTTHYAAAGALDPFDPTLGFNDNTVYKLDWIKGSFQPVYSLAAQHDPNDLFPPAVMNITDRVILHGPDTYIYTNDGWTTVSRCTLLRDNRWRSVAAVGMVLDPAELRRNIYAPAALAVKFSNPVFTGHIGEAFAWADRNGDGIVQPDEIAFSKIMVDGKAIKLHSTGWGQLPGADGTMVYYNPDSQTLIKFPIISYTGVGAPVYDPAHAQILKVDHPLVQDNEGMIAAGSNGVTYFNADPLFAVDKSGHVLWTYPSNVVGVHGSHNAKAARPGYLIGPNSILGMADIGGDTGEVFDMNGNLGENYLFTHDGFFVQSLFKDTRAPFETPDRAVRGQPMDDITGGGESFGGNFVRTTDGHVYLTIGGTDARVLEVTNLDTLHRLPPARLHYTPALYETALKFSQAQVAQANAPKVYTIARTAMPVTIEGKADEWPELSDDRTTLMDIQENPQQRYARVQARYDDQNLYLAYRVFAPANHIRNAGQDTRLLFKTGDAVDLMIGPASTPNGTGSLRLLMTAAQGKPIAILNQKVAPGAPASEHYKFSAGWHSVAFDRVTPVPQVQIATGPIEGGYFVEAAIPWNLIGVKPHAGLHLSGDVGALFADSGGAATVSRQYWSNKATGLVNDVPGEADLTPELWGTFVLQ